MNGRPVLVFVLDKPTGLVAAHLPPLGFAPPPPEQWANMLGLYAACGAPCPSPLAAYGERYLIEAHDARGELTVLWCARCFPMAEGDTPTR